MNLRIKRIYKVIITIPEITFNNGIWFNKKKMSKDIFTQNIFSIKKHPITDRDQKSKLAN